MIYHSGYIDRIALIKWFRKWYAFGMSTGEGNKSKYRSIDIKYNPWVLKEYKYWTLLLHDDQWYLGRAYVWLVREGGMQRFSELENPEYIEMKMVMQEYEQVLENLYNTDFMNYAWLANMFVEHGGHGHLHLIPRYRNERIFAGTTFIDGRWGKNYSPSEEFKPAENILIQIRDAIKNELSTMDFSSNIVHLR